MLMAMRTDKSRNWVFRAGQLSGLAAMALLGLVDVLDLMGSWPYDPFRFGPVVLPLAAAAVWLPAHHQGSRLLPSLVIALAAGSLLTTLRLWRVNASGGLWGLSELAGLLIVLLVTTRRGATALTALAVAITLAALLVQPMRTGLDQTRLALGMAQAMIATGVVGAGVYLRHLDDTRQRQLTATRAEQRAEFARDLHDFIAHHVTGIVVQAQGARLVAEHDPARAATALEQIEQAGAETMSAMRRMVGMLRGGQTAAPLAPLHTLADLALLVEAFTAAGGPPVRLSVEGVPDRLPVHVTTSAYRVVMEALTNVRQHARQATVVKVAIARSRNWLVITVVDDGMPDRNVLVRDRAGFGLAGLAERVGSIGGHLRAGPEIGRGWALNAMLPLHDPAPAESGTARVLP
jgi:signal transduction histidine kinase